MVNMRTTLLAGVLSTGLLAAAPAWGQIAGADPDRPLVPASFELAEAAGRAIDAEWLTAAERAELRVFHGVWGGRDLEQENAALVRAMVALNAWRFDDPALANPQVPVELRAEARLLQGELRDAIALLDGATTIRAARIRAEALEGLGEYAKAGRAIERVVAELLGRRLDEASELTDGVRGLALRARVDGQPARDYEVMIGLIARAHQELDRLYWPARLAEAELLLDKHNDREGVDALHETLHLNPRCARAWYRLGRVALDKFDFDGVGRALAALRRVDGDHPLAELLHAETRLVQNDPDEALGVLRGLVARWPRLRPAHAFIAAGEAIRFDGAATAVALARCDELSPGSAEAHFTAGRFLSMFRQYDDAAAMLQEAIARQPQWPHPRLEMGLMEMQTGRDERALEVLQALTGLDPFNKRAANSLFLLEEIADYTELDTEHFTIRYRPGVDEVLVDLMPRALEEIHETVASRFGWELDRRTIIEVMPDHERFAVRITGMPHIHTIAACTGPIIALEVPRDGPPSKHLGPFDWRRVLQHEYTHTITLDQTHYRIPHWLTEAAAVGMEHAPRDYDDCVMLARSYRDGTLFDLDGIKWAFVRPKRPGDRGKAYTQGHWMVEFMEERFGSSALVALLGRYFEGEREEEAMRNALGIERDEFFRAFLEWAGGQVEAWGLAPEPSMVDLLDEVRWSTPELAVMMAASSQARLDAIAEAMVARVGQPAPPGGPRRFTADQWPPLMRPPVEISDEQLAAWLAEHPDHPDLVEEDLRRRLARGAGASDELIADLERLTRLRPVDPFPHRKLAQIYLDGPTPEAAIPHLEELDVREQKTPVYARELATLYRRQGDTGRALDKAVRAVTMNPYHAQNRELAAAVAIEARRLDEARLHVKALTLLEPDRPQHERRLQRLDELIGASDR
jgi:tetratricopeptide (TPR) repeat protein